MYNGNNAFYEHVIVASESIITFWKGVSNPDRVTDKFYETYKSQKILILCHKIGVKEHLVTYSKKQHTFLVAKQNKQKNLQINLSHEHSLKTLKYY